MSEKQKFITFRDLHKLHNEASNAPAVSVKQETAAISADLLDQKDQSDQQLSMEKTASLEIPDTQARKISTLEIISRQEIASSQEIISTQEKSIKKEAISPDKQTFDLETFSSQEIISRHNKVNLMASLPTNKGYTKIPNAIYDNLLPQLLPGEQIVFMHLYRLSWGFGKPICNISLERIAHRTGYSSRQIQTILNQLIERGLVKKEQIILGKGKGQGLILRVENISDLETISTQEKFLSMEKIASLEITSNNKDLKKKLIKIDNQNIKNLAEIIDYVRSANVGKKLPNSELSALVKEECLHKGVVFDLIVFSELVK